MSLNKIPSSEYIYRQFDIINAKLKTLECQIDKLDTSGFQCSDLLSCNTDKLPEGISNLYFTDNRAITALTGEDISIFNNDSGYITNTALAPYLTIVSAASTYYPLTNPSAYIALTALSAGTGISYNNLTGVITNTAPNLPDYIQSISDTNTVDLDVSASNLTANVRHQDSTTINLSDDASGLKADLATGAAVANLGYTPENVANKATDFTTINNTLYPTVEAASDLVNLKTGYTAYITTGNVTTTSSTPSNITGLLAPLEANKRYRIFGVITIGCNNTGGVQFGANVPASSTFRLTLIGFNTGTTNIRYSTNISSGVLGGAFNAVNSASGAVFVFGEVETDVTAGDIQFILASGVNTQTSTVFELSTWINVTEL